MNISNDDVEERKQSTPTKLGFGGKAILTQPSSSNLVAEYLNVNDMRFMKYIANTLGTSIILKPGKGHYTYGTTAQMITCLYVVLFYSAMTTVPSGNNALIHKYHGDDADNILNALKSSLNNGSFDGVMVLVLLYHVGIMVIDRVSYLYRDLRIKVFLHICTCIFTHGWVFFGLQNSTKSWVSDNKYLLGYYILQLWFIIISSRQIKDGYPVFPSAGIEASKEYTSINGMAFKTWRAIPMLREMYSIFNWICTETSLDMFMWIQMDDIYATLVIVKYNMAYRKRDQQVLSGTKSQPFLYKFIYGWVIFGSLLLAMVGPLMLFSTLSNGLSDYNDVLQTNLEIQLRKTTSSYTSRTSNIKSSTSTTTYPLYTSYSHATIVEIVNKSSPEFNCYSKVLAPSYKYAKCTGNLQTITIPSYSDNMWSITPIGMKTLGNALAGVIDGNDGGGVGAEFGGKGDKFEIVMKYTFLRLTPSNVNGQTNNANTTYTESVRLLNDEDRCKIAKRIGINITNTTKCKRLMKHTMNAR